MKCRVLGIEEKKGVYNGREWSNYRLQVLLIESKTDYGFKVDTFKVSKKVLMEPQNILNKDVSFNFDRYGNICSINL